MKKIIIAFATIALAVAICLGAFTSCADAETTKAMDASAREMIDCLVAKDFDAAYNLIKSSCTEAQFKEFFDYITPFFENVGDYTLTQTGWNSQTGCNGTFYSIFYSLSFEGGEKSYKITATAQKGGEGLAGFKVE